MSKALYRKYRSKTLNEVIGQSHVTDILERSLAQGRISHAYLLTGPRGVGKTSIARILAHEINKLPYDEDHPHLDIIEIDAASNNGVEDVRDLRSKVQIAPVSADKKVYIIDEVHMLSKAAFNALLKTLEEPPEHVVFILATTDADKLPATIVSRTQRFGFRAIKHDDIINHLKVIAKKEKIIIDDESLSMIATRGDGSFRDSISLLDQLSSLTDQKSGITKDLVETALGLVPSEHVKDLFDAIKHHDSKKVISLLDRFEKSGIQSTVLSSQLITTIRQKISEDPKHIELLDHLLEVGKSSQPSIKLLTVLVKACRDKPAIKSAALSAPLPSISVPIAALEKEATKPIPKDPVKKSVLQPIANTPALAVVPVVTQQAANPDKFDWDTFIEYNRVNCVAIFSVLTKCRHELEGSTLTLYTGSKFYKTKLDDIKYLQKIIDSLREIGAGDLTIVTIPSAPPPKDSQAAAVAAIMGGGEEVSV